MRIIKNILIIDDKKENLEIIKTYLKDDHDFKIVTALNSREALEILDNKKDDFDLILINTRVPGTLTDGFYSMKPNMTPVEADTDAFLPAPFTREQLIDFINISMKKID
ncbi:MAG: response regulator [Candidatus Thermoplasmatota archaeon]